MFRFHEGQSVSVRADHPKLDLKTGDIGVVWAMYAAESPLYEVTFCAPDGEPFDVTMTEDELMAVETATPKAARKSGKRQVEAA